MGVDAGFDIVPRLSKGIVDRQKWGRFIDFIKEYYKDDSQVEIKPNYIDFKAGEHPKLPFEGHKCLRFSSKVLGSIAEETKAERYINTVTRIAQELFGSRIRCWHEGADQFGVYNWTEVHESIRPYEQPDELKTPSSISQLLGGTDPIAELGIALFEIKDIPGKGKGLVAHFNIPQGTRIICEKPLLRAGPMPRDELEGFLGTKLKAMSKESQRQFLSLHNSFPAKKPFSGIFRTNALPCGSGSSIGGVYPTSCLINHSCMPNAHNNWNSDKEHETIHAIRSIERGAEITISYDHGGTSILDQEFDGCAGALIPRLYYDAFQISIAHGDQARASIFAERAYKARVTCEGEDSSETLRAKSFALKPAVHGSFEVYSRKWKSVRDSVSKGLDTDDFDKRLFRQKS
ncbi:set domain-containing protein 5 [Botrytis cinerea]